jgi:hypothetical protein
MAGTCTEGVREERVTRFLIRGGSMLALRFRSRSGDFDVDIVGAGYNIFTGVVDEKNIENATELATFATKLVLVPQVTSQTPSSFFNSNTH